MLSGRVARTAVATVCATFTACAGVVALPASTAHAEERTVQGGRLDWGVKSSFQRYVTGPIAKGNFTLQGGAATVGGSQFRFHSASGSYDPDTGAFRAGFTGGVRFTGHQKPNGELQLDLSISRPTVRITGGSGTLHVDMVSKELKTGKVTRSTQVPMASLNLSGIDMRGGGSPIALTNVPATLTAQGAKAFAGYYTAGTALDPVNLSADVTVPKAPAEGPSARQPAEPGRTAAPEESGTPGKKPEEKPAEKPGKKPAKAGRIEDAAVDWGVRRTFREYVTGSIAGGKWTLAGGAQDGGALFRFTKGTGTYRKEALDAAFAGSVRFTGKHGLDLTLSKVAVTTAGDRGTLYADVRSPELRDTKVPLVTFDTSDLKTADGLVTVTEAPARLTERGAKAFNGMYKAGTAMDPVSFAVALDEDARLPALPDLGSDLPESPAPERSTAEAAPSQDATEKTASPADSSEFPVVPVAAGAGVLLLAAAAFGVLRARRRKAAGEG
ncbi:HtaA domain-containing protein [Streptomyces sp. NPDC002490]|uniref:HtaA domain-containing protein n=1 Tax=Streptomyces sp. NPDC002490 TaxID=3154416 RepID=UPI003321D316